jgi:hypothetical protein
LVISKAPEMTLKVARSSAPAVDGAATVAASKADKAGKAGSRKAMILLMVLLVDVWRSSRD